MYLLVFVQLFIIDYMYSIMGLQMDCNRQFYGICAIMDRLAKIVQFEIFLSKCLQIDRCVLE